MSAAVSDLAEDLQLLVAGLGPEWRYAGSVAVDGGAVLVSDPGSIPAAPLAVDPDGLYGELGLAPDAPATTAVACRSGLGDGLYPVLVRVVELPDAGERVAELRVLFLPELQEVG